MKLGLLGYPLGHSYSKDIHNYLMGIDYQMYEIAQEDLDNFMKEKNFDGINVTIPYKETVIDYLDEISEEINDIQAINCIVNKEGKLKGYNTDYLGFNRLLDFYKLDVKDKKVAILGSGGGAKACKYALDSKGAKVDIISRYKNEEKITYEELNEKANEYAYIVNTTPLGLYPNTEVMPNIDLDKFSELLGVIDIIANPLNTKLMFEAKCRGIKTYGGLRMLVYQAGYAEEIFLDKEIDWSKVEKCYIEELYKHANILLIGMPTSGKSTIAKLISEKTNLKAIDMDILVEEAISMKISECFNKYGEAYFREKEKEVAQSLANERGLIIASGGGVIKDEEVMRYLSKNSITIWIDRNKEDLFPSEDRPLSMNKEDLYRLYEERYSLYERYADIRIINEGNIEDITNEIIEKVGEKL